jgi:hypothetical protein
MPGKDIPADKLTKIGNVSEHEQFRSQILGLSVLTALKTDDVRNLIHFFITLEIQIYAAISTQSMHYILHSIYNQCTPITNKFLYLFLLQSLHDYLCCRARHTHTPHLLQPTLPPLQKSICSKAIWSSNSMSIYLFDCFLARLSAPVTFLCVNATHLAKNRHAYTV